MRRVRIVAIIGASGLLCGCGLFFDTARGPTRLEIAATGGLSVTVSEPRRTQAFADIAGKVTFKLSGANVPAQDEATVLRDSMIDGRFEVGWANLLPGMISVDAKVFDAGDRLIATASGSTDIEAGATAALDLPLQALTDGVSVGLDLNSPVPTPSVSIVEQAR